VAEHVQLFVRTFPNVAKITVRRHKIAWFNQIQTQGKRSKILRDEDIGTERMSQHKTRKPHTPPVHCKSVSTTPLSPAGQTVTQVPATFRIYPLLQSVHVSEAQTSQFVSTQAVNTKPTSNQGASKCVHNIQYQRKYWEKEQ
jgi:hypothetical protein